MTQIYDVDRMQCRTNIQQLNNLFKMGQELEGKVDNITPSSSGITITDTSWGIIIDYSNTGSIIITEKENYYTISY